MLVLLVNRHLGEDEPEQAALRAWKIVQKAVQEYRLLSRLRDSSVPKV